METLRRSTPEISVGSACDAVGLPRATFYRHKNIPFGPQPLKSRPSPERTLSADERQQALDILHSERFINCAPRQVYAKLLDEGIYICSTRTMYRTLEAEGEVKERRNQLRHPAYKKPELLAEGPNQVWSWDITKLKGPAKCTRSWTSSAATWWAG
jgi:putative transposase